MFLLYNNKRKASVFRKIYECLLNDHTGPVMSLMLKHTFRHDQYKNHNISNVKTHSDTSQVRWNSMKFTDRVL